MINKDRKFDVRTLERGFEMGRISREEYDAFLTQLEDVADNAAPLEAEYIEGVLKLKNDE